MRLQYFRGNVFVANLPPDLTEDELAEAFDPFGIVLSAFIARDPENGRRLRYGFVDIATEKAAKLAVAAMNGAAIGGHNLDVRISERPNKAKRPASARRQRAPPRRGQPLAATTRTRRGVGFHAAHAAAAAADISGRAPLAATPGLVAGSDRVDPFTDPPPSALRASPPPRPAPIEGAGAHC